MKRKRGWTYFWTGFLLFFSPIQAETFQHIVQEGETVYSLSKKYQVSVEDIYSLNPESRTNLRTGASLKIPQAFNFHIIAPQETLYSISRQYQVSIAELLAANPGLSIETFTIGKKVYIPRKETVSAIKVALLLPFESKENTGQKDIGKRMVEYYEGFLLSLKELKKQGLSVDLQVFDIGTDIRLLQETLMIPSLQKVHLLIGGINEEQIQLLSNFSHQYHISYVIPFSNRTEHIQLFSNVYQINPPSSYIYNQVASFFVQTYKQANILFYTPDGTGNKLDFIKKIQTSLESNKKPYQIIHHLPLVSSNLSDWLDISKENILIPSDDGPKALEELIAFLKSTREIYPQISITLFGYPTWQIYSSEHLTDFFAFHTIFYTVFYIQQEDKNVKAFMKAYHDWYSKNLMNLYPKYSLFGYDTGRFFLPLLSSFRFSLSEHIHHSDAQGLQTDFSFRSLSDHQGWINTSLSLIEFHLEGFITKRTIQLKK